MKNKYPLSFILFFVLPLGRLIIEVMSTLNVGGTLTLSYFTNVPQLALILVMFIFLWIGMHWPKYVIAVIVILSQVLFITPTLLIPLPEVKFSRTLTRFIFVVVGYLEFFMPDSQAKTIEDEITNEPI